jgi:hypothetical protein
LNHFSSWLPALGFEVEAQKFGIALSQEIYNSEDLHATTVVRMIGRMPGGCMPRARCSGGGEWRAVCQ